MKGRKAQGIRYEQAGHEYLRGRVAGYRSNPWIKYVDALGTRYCQPDGIVEFAERILLVEFKYQHTRDAWKQLRTLYEPIAKHLYPGLSVSVLEICKWYDPAEAFPEPVVLVKNPEDHTGSGFGVHIWRP